MDEWLLVTATPVLECVGLADPVQRVAAWPDGALSEVCVRIHDLASTWGFIHKVLSLGELVESDACAWKNKKVQAYYWERLLNIFKPPPL